MLVLNYFVARLSTYAADLAVTASLMKMQTKVTRIRGHVSIL